jgi:hypothetical protein
VREVMIDVHNVAHDDTGNFIFGEAGVVLCVVVTLDDLISESAPRKFFHERGAPRAEHTLDLRPQ